MNYTSSNIPHPSTDQVASILESKYSFNARVGLYRITQEFTALYNPPRKWIRRGYSNDKGFYIKQRTSIHYTNRSKRGRPIKENTILQRLNVE